MNKLLSILGTILLLTACGDKVSTYAKSVGQCGENWGTKLISHNGSAVELSKPMDILDSLNIPRETLTTDSLGPLAVCIICENCPSGWYYLLDAESIHEEQLIELGFMLK